MSVDFDLDQLPAGRRLPTVRGLRPATRRDEETLAAMDAALADALAEAEANGWVVVLAGNRLAFRRLSETPAPAPWGGGEAA